MNVLVATGDVKDISYGEGTGFITAFVVNEDGTPELDLRGYKNTPTVKVVKWWKNIREPLPALVTAEGEKDWIVSFRNSDTENIRKCIYKGLRVASVEGYKRAVLRVKFDTSVHPRRLKTNINRLILGIKDYIAAVPSGSIENIVIYLDNKEKIIPALLCTKLDEHGF